MRRIDRLDDQLAGRTGAFRICRGNTDPSPCLSRDWYEACLDCIAELEDHAARHGDLSEAFAPWCDLCAAVGEGLNRDLDATGDDDAGDPPAGPIAKWLLRRLNRRFG